MSRLLIVVQAAPFLLFPLLFMVLATAPIHPRLAGSADEQIRQVAEAATRWRLVHFGLAAACVFGALTTFSLASLVPGRLLSPAARSVSVAGGFSALALIGVFWQELVLVPSVAKACAGVEACLAPENAQFFESFAQLGWRKVPYLAWAGIGLTGSLLLLGALAWRVRVLRFWEALPVVVGCGAIIIMAPGLHGDAIFGFSAVLVGLASFGGRRVWTSLR